MEDEHRASARLSRLAADYYDHLSEVSPTSAHMRGDYRFAATFESLSRASEDADIESRRHFADSARAIDPSVLAPTERVTRDVLVYDAESNADLAGFRLAEIGVDPVFGLHVSMPIMLPQLTVDTAALAEAMISKLGRIAVAIDDTTERWLEGARHGRRPPRFAVERVVAQLGDLIGHDPSTHPFGRVRVPESFDESAAAGYRRAVIEKVAGEIVPALDRQRDVLTGDLAESARADDRVGLCALDDGASAYAAAIRKWTTLDSSAEEIHQIGLAQVARLADEYAVLGSEALGLTEVAEILDALRDDPDLQHRDPDEIVRAAERALAGAAAEMGDWFGRLPRADCLVDTVTSGPLAFYHAPADDGSRPGTFFMNVADPTSWGRYLIEAMVYHEGIPGHHVQVAIAQELGDVIPRFQRDIFISAYGEGWALYTERLADEMGLYSSPLDRLGMLWGDSMRACRLVVDTGLHALGWSRQRAIDYMVANCPMKVEAIRSEIDRYVVFPGQALSYMLGRLEIDRLRARAEEALGDRFDLPGFHDVVLGQGLVPLPTLARMVDDWIAA